MGIRKETRKELWAESRKHPAHKLLEQIPRHYETLATAPAGRDYAENAACVFVAIGSVGLIGIAGICWWLIPNRATLLALGGASFAWLLVSFTIWAIRQRRRRFTLSR